MAWNLGHQVVSAGLSLGAMLVLVRLVSPEEYGQAAVVLAFLQVANVFGCAGPISQALQLPGSERPDWALHWRCGLPIQASLTTGTVLLGLGLSATERFRSIGPLLMISAVGLLLDLPSRLRSAQLQREMEFGRLRLILLLGTLLSIAVSIALAVLGLGATGLVLAAHVAPAIPTGVDLLWIERWRPNEGWVGWPAWRRYLPALRFGLHQATSGLLLRLRGFVTGIAVPAAFGLEVLGLLGRAEGILGTTALRLHTVASEAMYPVLPRVADRPRAYRLWATRYLEATSAVVIIGATFLVAWGPLVSRVLYGERWVAADPLIAPLTIMSGAVAIGGSAYRLLLARNLLVTCTRLDIGAGVLMTAPAATLLLTPLDLESFAWMSALAGVAVAVLPLAATSMIMGRGFVPRALGPSLGVAGGAQLLTGHAWRTLELEGAMELCVLGATYVSASLALWLLVSRAARSRLRGFARALVEVGLGLAQSRRQDPRS